MNRAENAEDLLRRWSLPGCVATVFDRGNTETWSFGVPEDSPFPLASVTKPFTAELVELHLDPDVPLHEVLEDFHLFDPVATELMTVRDALCHFSGLPPHTWAWVYGDVDRPTFVRDRLPFLRSVGPYSDSHRYSNILYAVLGEALASVAGQTWEALVEQHFRSGLGLSRLTPLDQHWYESAPQPHRFTSRGPEPCPPFVARRDHPIAPASELSGSVPDVATWGQTLLNRGGNRKSWQGQNTVSTDRPHPSMGPLEYGLGWRLDTVKGENRVWHSGQCSGFTTLLSLYPESGKGMAVATNVSGAVDVLHALDLYLQCGIEPDWAKMRVSSDDSSANSPAPAGSVPEGTFRNPGYGELNLFTRDGVVYSRFQASAEAQVMQEASGGMPMLELPEYGVSFPIHFGSTDSVKIPFESEVAPIVFKRTV